MWFYDVYFTVKLKEYKSFSVLVWVFIDTYLACSISLIASIIRLNKIYKNQTCIPKLWASSIFLNDQSLFMKMASLNLALWTEFLFYFISVPFLVFLFIDWFQNKHKNSSFLSRLLSLSFTRKVFIDIYFIIWFSIAWLWLFFFFFSVRFNLFLSTLVSYSVVPVWVAINIYVIFFLFFIKIGMKSSAWGWDY